MTSQKAQIQALISGIDEVLSKNGPRLPWVMSNDAIQQRQILEQTRQYLASLQQQIDAEPSPTDQSPALPEFTSPALPSSQSASESPAESAQQVLQAVLQEMNYWRVNMLQPLRTEVDSLQRQRELLTQEIRQLEAQRQQYGLPGQPNQQLLMEFLQSAMAQMQANLSGQVTQMIAGLSAQSNLQPAALQSADRGEAQNMAALSPAERLAQMQKVQVQSDQLMLKLDSTLQIIFESLNRNVQTYQDSLEQGLNRMHGLGQQGEAMFAFLVNRLAQQLGREASSFLQTTTPDWQASNPSLPDAPDQTAEFRVDDFLSQVPEPSHQSTSFAPAVPFDISEEVLDIADLDLPDQSEQPDPALEANNLKGLDLELSQLDLSVIPTESESAEPLDLFAGDQPLPSTSPTLDVAANSEAPNQDSAPLITDLDSALDLLNQLSAEMQAGMMVEEVEPNPPSNPAESVGEALIPTPDSLYDDAFYDSFFQETAETAPVNASSAVPDSDTTINALTLEQEWFGGLDDPAAQSENAQSETELVAQPEFPTGSVTQSLETFLLNDTAPAPAVPSTDLFAEFVTSTESDSSTVAPEPPPEPPVETIASLTELIPDVAQNSAVRPETAFPEESLLIAEAPIEDLKVDLGMAADSLEQLGTDLAQPATPTESKADAGWDVFADLPDVTEEPAEPIDSDPAAMTIEGLEELFGEVPDQVPGTPATPAQASSDAEAVLADLFSQFDLSSTTPPSDSTPLSQTEQLFDREQPSDPTSSDSEKKN